MTLMSGVMIIRRRSRKPGWFRENERGPRVYQRLRRTGGTGAAFCAGGVVLAVSGACGCGLAAASTGLTTGDCSTAGGTPIAIRLLNAMPMWYWSTPFLLTFATELRATRPSIVAGENVPSKTVVTAVPNRMRLVHSTRIPLAEIFSSVASVP